MPRFERIISGNYSPERGTIKDIEIMISDIRPSEMQNLCNLIKKWCEKPKVSDPDNLDVAARMTEMAEFPKEKKTRLEKEKRMKGMRKNPTGPPLHRQIMDGITEYLESHGPASKEELKTSTVGEPSPTDKEYFAFHAAFQYLQRKEKIRRVNPNEPNSDWIVEKEE